MKNENHVINVGMAIINHPLVTIFMGGVNHQKWVVYDIAIPTRLILNFYCHLRLPEETNLHLEPA